MAVRQRLLTLHPCPGCGIEIQRGTGPHRLAQHRCNASLSVDDVVQVALRRAMKMLEQPSLTIEEFQRVAKAVATLRTPVVRPVGRPPVEKPATPEEVNEKEQSKTLRMLTTPTLDE